MKRKIHNDEWDVFVVILGIKKIRKFEGNLLKSFQNFHTTRTRKIFNFQWKTWKIIHQNILKQRLKPHSLTKIQHFHTQNVHISWSLNFTFDEYIEVNRKVKNKSKIKSFRFMHKSFYEFYIELHNVVRYMSIFLSNLKKFCVVIETFYCEMSVGMAARFLWYIYTIFFI